MLLSSERTINMKYIQILFVVETNNIVKSDDLYYSWVMRNYYGDFVSNQGFDDIRITFNFVHMDGKTNYKKDYVLKEIRSKTNMFVDGKTYVVYCIDHDKVSAQNAAFIEEVSLYCKNNNAYLAVCYREIEDVLSVPQGKSKSERVRLFAKKPPKKDFIDRKRLSFDMNNLTHDYGRSNVCLVIDEIILKSHKMK